MKRVFAGSPPVAALACALALAPAGALRADFTWNGGAANDLWTDGGNWVGGTAPGFDVQDRLVFGATGGAQSPDAGADDWTNILAISFTGADAPLTLIGTGTLSLADADGISEITNDSAFLQTINIDVIANGANLILDAVAGDLTLGGDIDISDSAGAGDGVLLTVQGDFDTTLLRPVTGANGSLLKTGAGTLTLDGANTYGGGTTLMQGTIVLGSNSALGTGALSVTGDASLQSDDDGRNVDNDITIADAVTLTFSGSNDLHLDGFISGDGSLEVNTAASTVELLLTRNNSFGGGTTLTQGTIVLGHNRALSTGTLTVTGNGVIESNNDQRRMFNDVTINAGGALTFSGDSDLDLRGVISGDGGLVLNTDNDDERLTLRGENTYTGGTILARGTVVAANDAAFGTGAISVTGDSTMEALGTGRVISNDITLGVGGTALTIAGDTDDLELSGILSGPGGLTKSGTSTLTLSGASTYTGDTNVDGGTLLLTGSLTSDVNVNADGTFGGNGMVTGNLTNLSGGTVAPGDNGTIDTLSMTGDYDQQAGSELAVTLSADNGTSDLLDVTGNATLASGSTIRASVQGDGFIASGQTFTVLRASGTLTDNGAGVVTDSATVTISFNPDSNVGDGSYELVLFRAANAYANAAIGGNNNMIGLALDSLQGTANADPTGDVGNLLGKLDTFNSDDYNTALNELSPERLNAQTVTGFATAEAFAITQADYLAARRLGFEAAFTGASSRTARTSLGLPFDDPVVLASIFTRMRQDHPDPAAEAERVNRWGNYAKLQGVFVDQDMSDNRTGFRSRAFGGQFGVDYNLTEDVIFGVAFGYLFNNNDLDAGLGTLDDHSLRTGPYLSWTSGNVFVDASATFAYHFYEGTRDLPTLGLSASSDYDGFDMTGYAGTGFHYEVARDVFLTPNVSVQGTYFSFDGFTETGGGGANLSVESRDAYSLRSRVGFNLSSHVDWGWNLYPYVFAGWEHEFGDDDDIAASFAAGGSPFLINTGSRARDGAYYGGGVNALLAENVSAFVRIEGNAASRSSGTGFAAGVSIGF